MNNQSNPGRFEIDDYIKKGYKCYPVSDSVKNRELYSKVLYFRYFLENFYIGDLIFVKNRKVEN